MPFIFTWFDPFAPFSIMTCLVQWGIVLVVFVLANRCMVRRALRSQDETSDSE